MIDPLPAAAFELSIVFPPAQNVAIPEIVAVGIVFTETEKGVDVKEQPWLLMIVAVYEPATEAE